jgi:hypothetical protein
MSHVTLSNSETGFVIEIKRSILHLTGSEVFSRKIVKTGQQGWCFSSTGCAFQRVGSFYLVNLRINFMFLICFI